MPPAKYTGGELRMSRPVCLGGAGLVDQGCCQGVGVITRLFEDAGITRLSLLYVGLRAS